jgi:N utilization substance protein A
MGQEIIQAIEQIGKEKGIDKHVLIEAVESAIVSAAKRKLESEENLEAHLDPENGEVELVCLKVVVEKVENPELEIQFDEIRNDIADVEIGDEVEIKKDNFPLGRIAAQTAKQVIMQKVREAERDMVYNYFESKRGQLITGRVNRVEKGDIFIDLERGEAILPKREQAPRDFYKKGDTIRGYLLDTIKTQQGTQVLVSRTHPDLLIKLFEVEVPEITEKIVEIMRAEREPGGRAKICVRSTDTNVDPVGACVGIKGSRVQAVVRELKGENIDIIEWTDDPIEFITRALNPANISEIKLDEDTKTAGVVVAEDQLSLAIGKKGQNVRLACRLTGWQIDITGSGVEGQDDQTESTEVQGDDVDAPETDDTDVDIPGDDDSVEEVAVEDEIAGETDEEPNDTNESTSDLHDLTDIDEKTLQNLIDYGIDSIQKLKEMTLEELTSVPMIDTETAEIIWQMIPREIKENDDGIAG